MQEFATEWAGRAPSTDDFRVIAERHQTAEMDLSGDGTLNYFLDQWVYGTDIPRFESTLEVDDIGDNTYRISGSVTQSNVPDGFLSLVPLYLDFGDQLVKLGAVTLNGPGTQEVSGEMSLPRAPRRVRVNAFHDLLAR